MNAISQIGLVTRVLLVLFQVVETQGGATRQQPGLSPDAEAHWHKAEEAQRWHDYASAEREYRAVIAATPDFAEAYLNLGLVYQLQEQRSLAMAAFRHALRLRPQLIGANLFLGIDLCQEGEAASAIPYLAKVTTENPDLPDGWSWLATAQEMKSDLAAEVKTLEQGLRLRPQNIDLLYLQGRVYEALGKKVVEQAAQLDPDSVAREEFLAETYATSGYWSEALLHLQNILKREPQRPGAHVGIGEVFLHAGLVQKAREEIDAELERDPHSLRAVVRRGEVRLIEADVEVAFADWSIALQWDASRTETILGIRESGFGESAREQLVPGLRQRLEGLQARLQQRSGAASALALAFIAVQSGGPPSIRTFESRGQNDPVTPKSCTVEAVRVWLAQGRLASIAACGSQVLTPTSTTTLRLGVAQALYGKDQPGRALAVLDGTSANATRAPEILYWKARCFKKLALAAYLKLYAASPDSYRAHELQADMHAAQDEDFKAIEEYRLALTERPMLPNLHYQIGRLLWKNFKTEPALAELKAELNLNPRHSGALTVLGTIYLYQHQPADALTCLEKAAVLDPGSADVHQFLGTAYAQMHKYAAAVPQLKLAAAHDEDGKIHYQLAKAYQGMGRKEEAAREFATSNLLNQRFHSRSSERSQALAAAESTLRQP
jgi:tetratricopeptide (TPR) repeat protein